jgi:lipoprotein-anchoring transpeptidase ErfK/SrfK
VIVRVSVKDQTLRVYEGDNCLQEYLVSTAKKGLGEKKGSEQTPRGWHTIRAKIGEGAPKNSVFVGRRPTGEIYTPELAVQHPDRDWILTRILWLSGLEPGKNRLGNVDTMQRYIALHGSPCKDFPLGSPGSHGCIRMHSDDIVSLFDLVPIGTKVFIDEAGV